MGSLYQALDIIFEVQRKRSNEKITLRKISFLTYKMHFYFFFSLYPHLLSNLITFLFLTHFKQLKLCKSSLNSNSNKSIQGSFWMLGMTFVMFIGLFFSSWPPLLWGVVTFSILIQFWQILVHQLSNGGVQILFWTSKTMESSRWIRSALNT
jgi:hypothetical protein